MGSEYFITDTKYVRHKKGNIEVAYQISEMDMSTSTRYYLYVNNEGGWLIMSESEAAGVTSYRYACGWSDPDAAWAARAGLTYKTWHGLGEQI